MKIESEQFFKSHSLLTQVITCCFIWTCRPRLHVLFSHIKPQ